MRKETEENKEARVAKSPIKEKEISMSTFISYIRQSYRDFHDRELSENINKAMNAVLEKCKPDELTDKTRKGNYYLYGPASQEVILGKFCEYNRTGQIFFLDGKKQKERLEEYCQALGR